MPHNLYLHSSLVQTRKIDRTPKGIKEAIKFNFIDTTVALNIALFVNAAILILAAAAFFSTVATVFSLGGSGTSLLPRMKQCPVCLPVINAQRDGAQTVLPA